MLHFCILGISGSEYQIIKECDNKEIMLLSIISIVLNENIRKSYKLYVCLGNKCSTQIKFIEKTKKKSEIIGLLI